MFEPVNRYILIDVPDKNSETAESLIMLPDDYKPPEERYIQVAALHAAADVRFAISHNDQIIVDRSMIEEISTGPTNYSVILDNYVVGIIP